MERTVVPCGHLVSFTINIVSTYETLEWLDIKCVNVHIKSCQCVNTFHIPVNRKSLTTTSIQCALQGDKNDADHMNDEEYNSANYSQAM